MAEPCKKAPLSLPLQLVATLLGAGRSPFFPGTCGTLVAFAPLPFLPAQAYLPLVLAGLAIATGACVLLSRRLGESQDPGWFVLDEAAGLFVAVLAPTRPGLGQLALAFLLFRLFDMAKPWPLRSFEKVGGGLGIVLDDLGAGLYALALSSGVLFFLG